MDNRQSLNYWTEADVDAFLVQQLLRSRLALVIGAGASAGFGLPDWKTLIDLMYAAKVGSTPAGSLTQVAGHFKDTYYENDQVGFAEFVRECLYSCVGVSLDNIRDSKLLQALGALVANSTRGGAAYVVSFNFDDLLEEYLATIGIVACSEDHMPNWSHQVDVEVLHPHGLLPFDCEVPTSANGIVFTDDDYLKVMGNATDSWDRRMLDIFSSYTCLFIGLSGVDDRLMGLVKRAGEIHPAVQSDHHPFWGIVAMRESAENGVSEGRWKKQGVLPRKFLEYADIPDWIFKLCQAAARKRRSEALSK